MALEGVFSCLVPNVSRLDPGYRVVFNWVPCYDVLQVYVHLGRSWNWEDGHGARGDQVSTAGSRAGGDPTIPLRRD